MLSLRDGARRHTRRRGQQRARVGAGAARGVRSRRGSRVACVAVGMACGSHAWSRRGWAKRWFWLGAGGGVASEPLRLLIHGLGCGACAKARRPGCNCRENSGGMRCDVRVCVRLCGGGGVGERPTFLEAACFIMKAMRTSALPLRSVNSCTPRTRPGRGQAQAAVRAEAGCPGRPRARRVATQP